MMGKHTGYDIDAAGHILPAPIYAEELCLLRDKSRAIEHLMQSVTAHCVMLNQGVEAEVRKLWIKIADDYGLDLERNSAEYFYYGNKIRLTRLPPKAKRK